MPPSTKRQKKSSRPKNPTPARRLWQRLRGEQARLVYGWLGIGLGLFLLGAFGSFFLHWESDQSLLENELFTSLADRQRRAQNHLGKLGAQLGHFFIFKGFGISAFWLALLSLWVGLRTVFHLRPAWQARHVATALFLLVWGATTMGYLQGQPNVWSGATGYFSSDWLRSWAGPVGTAVLLLIALLAFLTLRLGWTPAVLSAGLQRLASRIEALFPKKDPAASGEEAHLAARPDTAPPEERPETSPPPEAEPESTAPSPSFEVVNAAQGPNVEAENPDPDDPEETEPREEDTLLEIEKTAEEEALSKKELSQKVKEFGEYDPKLDLSRFKLPRIDLLKDHGGGNIKINQQELEENKDRILATLKNYNIDISKIKATTGPTVTLYEIVPAAGVRINKIKNLEDDIALSLAALGIRIIAPIPGRGTIGIEVPSTNPQIVPMRGLVAGEKFQQSEAELPIVLGKTISNETYVTDLAKMPHLLMAGATGQGKSVGLNVILTSLLYKKHPSQVKFVLVDPKKVELTLFNKIERHYLAKLPDTEEAIITDTAKVVNTLNSLCIEMDDRYELLKAAMTRNIKEYNHKFVNRKLNPEEGHRYLPYIVLVIDEFADLIMTAGKEVETPIARLAQLARAVGIHLIVATQRPSVNVITGIIKANFPARIAFRVTSKVDSRTILDAGGAEQLIGKGDMLMSLGQDLIRLQCAFVDTPEVEDVTDYIGSQQAYPEAYKLPEYHGEDEDGGGSGEIDPSDRDALFEDAARLLVIHQQGSTSLLQRKLKLGYNRAGRIIDQLEAAGVIGPFEGSKARQVLVQDEAALEQLLENEKNQS